MTIENYKRADAIVLEINKLKEEVKRVNEINIIQYGNAKYTSIHTIINRTDIKNLQFLDKIFLEKGKELIENIKKELIETIHTLQKEFDNL